jgi:hypothetical protein
MLATYLSSLAVLIEFGAATPPSTRRMLFFDGEVVVFCYWK